MVNNYQYTSGCGIDNDHGFLSRKFSLLLEKSLYISRCNIHNLQKEKFEDAVQVQLDFMFSILIYEEDYKRVV